MKALLLTAPNQLNITDMDVPKPNKGEVLVKIDYAPINPSDLSLVRGTYGLKKEMPVVPGLEGSGVVVASGGGVLPAWLKGKRVACAADSNGTWAEYMCTKATSCLPLTAGISQEQGSMLFVNPLTAIAFIQKVKEEKADVIVMNAAGGSLASMVYTMAADKGLNFVGLVRTEKPVERIPSKEIINTSLPGFREAFQDKLRFYKKVLFFDAIGGGSLPAEILHILPAHSKWVVYGRLDLSAALYDPTSLLFKDQQIESFWLSKKLESQSLFQTIRGVLRARRFLNTGYETIIREKVSIEQMLGAIQRYEAQMSGGKYLLSF